MPIAKRFTNEAALVSALRQCQWKESFRRGRREECDCDLKAIILHSVGRNTFRAFHNLPQKPGETFRTWAFNALDGARLQSLQLITSQSEYTEWLYDLSDHFRRFWKKQMQGREISYGPSLKLPNLLLKQLCLYREISDKSCERLVQYLEVPLDSYTIQAVANCVDSFPGGEAIGRVPHNATMSFIKNLAMYEAFQNGIRCIATKARVPAIALDVLAWNKAH